MAISAVALFCDDVRDEKSGANTLVGVYSDNVQLQPDIAAFAKLAVYVRIVVPVTLPPSPIKVILTAPNGDQLVLGEFDQEFVTRVTKEADERNSPVSGLIARATAAPFPVMPEGGRYVVTVETPSETVTAGTLNLIPANVSGRPS